MKKIKLFDRSEEIFNALPKEYSEIILNSIIAKSIQNGSLFSEVELFLNSEDFISFKKKFNCKKETKFTPKEIIERKEDQLINKRKTKNELKEEKASESFIL